MSQQTPIAPGLNGHSFEIPRMSNLLNMAAFLIDIAIAEVEGEEDLANEAEYRQLMGAAQVIRAWAEDRRELEDSVH